MLKYFLKKLMKDHFCMPLGKNVNYQKSKSVITLKNRDDKITFRAS